jgi:transcriptional regulator with XRE-family HTH domain
MTNEEFLKFVGMEFKIARTRQGLTLKEVAKLTGLSQATCGDIEGGKTDSQILSYKRMADALGISIKDFV